MSDVTLVQRLTSMRLPLGALWSQGQTRCCRRGSPFLQASLQVDGTVILAEGRHQGALSYCHSITRLQSNLSPMRLPLHEQRSCVNGSMRGRRDTYGIFITTKEFICVLRAVQEAAACDGGGCYGALAQRALYEDTHRRVGIGIGS